MRVAVGSMMQETNTFLRVTTGLDAFRSTYLRRGDELLTGYGAARVEVPAMLAVLREANVQPVPLLAAHAGSGGPVSRAAFEALTEGMLPYIPKYDAMLMANHGAVAYGEDILQAYHRMETVEHFARITLVAELLGGPKVLPRVEVQRLFEARSRYHVKSKNHLEPGAPMTAEDMPEPGEKIEMTRQQLLAIIDEALKVRGVF